MSHPIKKVQIGAKPDPKFVQTRGAHFLTMNESQRNGMIPKSQRGKVVAPHELWGTKNNEILMHLQGTPKEHVPILTMRKSCDVTKSLNNSLGTAPNSAFKGMENVNNYIELVRS